MALRLPDEVGAQIVLSRRDIGAGNEPAAFALRPVGLNAERVDDEDERAIALVEGVEMDLDVVVRADAVAIGKGIRYRTVRLEGADAEVDRRRRIPDADFGRIGSRATVGRSVEREAGQERGLLP